MLVVLYAARGVVVHAACERVAVEASTRGMVGVICLESKGRTSCPSQGRVAENAEPFDDKAEASLDTTTNLVGLPEEGEEVSAPAPLVSLSFAVALHTHDAFVIARLHGPVAWAACARRRR
jgi:hypothetical protein